MRVLPRTGMSGSRVDRHGLEFRSLGLGVGIKAKYALLPQPPTVVLRLEGPMPMLL